MSLRSGGLDRIVAVVGAVSSATLTGYILIRGGSLLYGLATLLAFGACMLWIFRGTRLAPKLGPYSSRRAVLGLLSAFFLLLTLSVLALYLRTDEYSRPVSYFALVALMTLTVGVELLVAPNREAYVFAILIQIIIIGVSLAWSEQLIYPSVTGIDPFWHRMFTLKLLGTSRIPSGYAYSSFPLTHLDTAALMLLINVEYKGATMLLMGLGQVLADVLFTFLLVRFLVHDNKVGLLSALLLIVADYHVQFGWWTTPSTFASIFMLAIVYAVFKLRSKSIFASAIIVTLLGIAMILSHTIVALAMTLFLYIVWLTSKLQNRKAVGDPKSQSARITVPAVFSILMLGWWAYAFAGPFSTLGEVIRSGFTIDAFYKGPRYAVYTGSVPMFELGLSVTGFVIYFGLGLLGSLYLLSKRSSILTSFSIGALTFLAVGFFSLVLGKEVLNVRWWYLSQIALAGPAAIGLLSIASLPANGRVRHGIVAMIVLALCFLMVTSPTANMDNPSFAPHLVARSAFTASEMEAASFISNHWNGSVSSDYIYASNPSSSVFANYYGVGLERILSLDPALVSGDFRGINAVIIIRQGISEGPFSLAGGLYQLGYDPNAILGNDGFDRWYDSGSVHAYKAVWSA